MRINFIQLLVQLNIESIFNLIIESIDAFIFPSLYSYVYLNTVETFVGAFYYLSELFFILTLIMFIIIYILVKKTAIPEDKADAENTEMYKAKDFEITKL